MLSPLPLSDSPQSADATELRRERLRFTGFRYTRTMHGDCTVSVELEWNGGVAIKGESTGPSSPVLDLRVAAEAALRAVEAFGAGEVALDLIGVKHVRAFDASVIIVAVGNRDPNGPARLLGSYLADGDPVRGTVIAVLAATNRLLGNVIARR